MAKVTLHPTIESLSGKMGDVVFRTNGKTGMTTMSKVPDMTQVNWSKSQNPQRGGQRRERPQEKNSSSNMAQRT